MTGVLTERGNLDTDIDMQREKTTGRDRVKMASISQRDRPATGPSFTVLRRKRPADTLILNF